MTIRIDFTRLIPGLVVLLVGLAFFALWLVLVFVSFFAFFVPGLGGVFYVALGVLVASLVLMACGGIMMLAGVSGWRKQVAGGAGWFGGADRDMLKPGDRAGEVAGVVFSLFVLLFFVENQLRGTGFFTPAFGPTEQALFYGTWAVGALAALARAAVGRRNPVRPLAALDGGLVMVTCLWLFNVFPFDFSHFPDLLPEATRFAFRWVSDPVGAIVLVLGGIGGLVSMVYNTVVFAARPR